MLVLGSSRNPTQMMSTKQDRLISLSHESLDLQVVQGGSAVFMPLEIIQRPGSSSLVAPPSPTLSSSAWSIAQWHPQ